MKTAFDNKFSDIDYKDKKRDAIKSLTKAEQNFFLFSLKLS